jgi:mono/diheme cytochrome c family protein
VKFEIQNKIKFWGVVSLTAAGAAGVFLVPIKSGAARSKAPPRASMFVNTNASLAQAAARVFHGQSCAGCHYLSGLLGREGTPLDRAAEHYDVDTLRRYIRNPRSVDPRSLMPPQQKVTDVQIDAIANFLAELPRNGSNSLLSHEHP